MAPAEEKIQPEGLKKGTLSRLSLAFILFLLPVLLFAKLATIVREQERLWLDIGVLMLVKSLASSALTNFFIFVTTIGDALLIAPLTATAGLYLAYIKHRRQATLVFFGIGGAAVINLFLKSIFQRPRPDLWQHLVEETGYSFPSGHAMTSSAVAFVLVLLCWHTRWRWWVVAGATVYMISVGVSRLYLGVHYPSDIVGGWCISIAWVWVVKQVIDTFGSPAKTLMKSLMGKQVR
ncbi:MAG TPA: phosphatase PAP2 family protein [Candidatus Saccharimonadales bacterium]